MHLPNIADARQTVEGYGRHSFDDTSEEVMLGLDITFIRDIGKESAEWFTRRLARSWLASIGEKKPELPNFVSISGGGLGPGFLVRFTPRCR